jgi:hypothetical protein
MTEEQANKIISLLSEILDKLPKKSSYDLGDLYHIMDDVDKSVKKVEKAVNDIDIN